MSNTKSVNTEEIQSKYQQLQGIHEQMKQYKEHIDHLTERIAELDSVIANVTELSNTPAGNDILVPISSGVFFSAKTIDTKNFLVNVGSKSVVKKDTDGVIALLTEQKKELNEILKTMESEHGKGEMLLQQLQMELQELIG
ncbi:MAG: prefoldin subunit alpha [Candidatus Woesearchaeota archaeon]